MPDVDPNQTYSINETIALTKCSRSSLYRAISRGELTATHIGSWRTVIRAVDLDAYLSAHAASGSRPSRNPNPKRRKKAAA